MLLIFHLLLNCNTFNKFLLKLKNEDKLFIMLINSNNSTSYISYSWIVTIQFWSTFLLTQLFILTFHFLNDAPCVSSYFLLGEQIQSNQSIIIRSQTIANWFCNFLLYHLPAEKIKHTSRNYVLTFGESWTSFTFGNTD